MSTETAFIEAPPPRKSEQQRLAEQLPARSALQIIAPGANSNYQGWNGTSWVNGPAAPQDGVFWNRAVAARASLLFAKTNRGPGITEEPPSRCMPTSTPGAFALPRRPIHSPTW